MVMSKVRGKARGKVKKSRLFVGQAVIVDDVDQPCSLMVAVITCVSGFSARVRYLSDDVRLEGFEGEFNVISRFVTPLSEFGVRLVVCDGRFSVVGVGDSVARYPDGRLRRWQEPFGYSRAARPEVLVLLRGDE